ncbi:hypothetical protein ACE1AT_03965 [Pelatocladus sp. BLCC-F211]|uniref:hypothetical protein n=1 Tax=Pelatocladus sp. BLCC-F211 TaxID=3342752 RepID=UPI0035B7ABFC
MRCDRLHKKNCDFPNKRSPLVQSVMDERSLAQEKLRLPKQAITTRTISYG